MLLLGSRIRELVAVARESPARLFVAFGMHIFSKLEVWETSEKPASIEGFVPWIAELTVLISLCYFVL